MTNLGKRPSRRGGEGRGGEGWGGVREAGTLAEKSASHTGCLHPLPGGRLSVIIGLVSSPKDCTV